MAQDDCRIISVSGRISKRRSQILLDGVKKSDRGSPQGHILISAGPGVGLANSVVQVMSPSWQLWIWCLQ